MNERQSHHDFTALGTELAVRIARAGFGGASVSITPDANGEPETSIVFDAIGGEQAFHAKVGNDLSALRDCVEGLSLPVRLAKLIRNTPRFNGTNVCPIFNGCIRSRFTRFLERLCHAEASVHHKRLCV